jgi:carboxyl-terminal processing protease
MRKLFIYLIAIFMFGWATAGQAAAPEKTARRAADVTKIPAVTKGLSQEQRAKNIESFETAWKTVRDSHYDAKLGGVDWDAVHKELLPKIEKADSMSAARNIMRDMTGRLGHSHVTIVAADFYDNEKGPSAKVHHQGVPGFHVRMVEGEALVTRVIPGLPAAKAGVRPGWIVRKINGEAVAPTLENVRKLSKEPYITLDQADVVARWLSGEEGKDVTVTFVDGDNKEVTRTLRRALPRGNRVQLGGLPPQHVYFESRKLDNNVAYFYMNSFADPARVMKGFANTVKDNEKANGFILDLRGNTGGLILMTQGIGNWLVDKPNQKLGTLTYRRGPKDLSLNPREVTYTGPLAILVDEFSMSSSEFLAGGLQDLKRARIFGRPTTGAALASLVTRLPNGDRLQYVIADYVSTGGKRLEGNGVRPDEIVRLDRQTLLSGRDADIDAALEWIHSQSGSAQK